MRIKKGVQKKIDAFAQKRLSHLQATTFPFEIVGFIDDFRWDLTNDDLINDQIDDKEITHSTKMLMELDEYFQSKNRIRFSSNYFGTEHRYVVNHKLGNGIIFIGHANNIYAAQLVFDCLRKIATKIRQAYMTNLKRYKKQSTKEERADEYVEEWFEDLIERSRDHEWYDVSYRKCYSDYVKKNFKTSEDERKIMLRAIEIIKPLYNIKKSNESRTWGEFKEDLFKMFPEESIKQTFKEVNEIQAQDIVALFSSEESIDEDY